MTKIKLIQVTLTTLTMFAAVKVMLRFEWFSQSGIFLQVALFTIGGAIVWVGIAYLVGRVARKDSDSV